MRRFTKILILASCFFILALQAVSAMDALLGEVVSIDEKRRLIVVSVDQNSDAGGARQIIVSYERQNLPGFAQPGAIVRLWGEYVQGNPEEFRLQRLQNGQGPDQGHDPTGVRFRLKQGQGEHGIGMGGNQRGRRH
jgi:hypothetical protein